MNAPQSTVSPEKARPTWHVPRGEGQEGHCPPPRAQRHPHPGVVGTDPSGLVLSSLGDPTVTGAGARGGGNDGIPILWNLRDPVGRARKPVRAPGKLPVLLGCDACVISSRKPSLLALTPMDPSPALATVWQQVFSTCGKSKNHHRQAPLGLLDAGPERPQMCADDVMDDRQTGAWRAIKQGPPTSNQ